MIKKMILGGTIVVCLLTEILDKFYLTNCVFSVPMVLLFLQEIKALFDKPFNVYLHFFFFIQMLTNAQLTLIHVMPMHSVIIPLDLITVLVILDTMAMDKTALVNITASSSRTELSYNLPWLETDFKCG